MRKNTARHWLHACLDLLPVLLIPVFMIYSHRHDVAQDFEVVEQVPVYYESNEVDSVDDLNIGNIYYWNNSWQNTNAYSTRDLFDIDIDLFLSQFTQYKQYNVIETRMLLSGNNTYNAYVLVRWTDSYDYFQISNKQFNFVIVNFLTAKNNIPSDYVDCISSSTFEYIKEYQEVVTTIPKDVMSSFLDRFNNSINTYFNMGNVFGMTNVYQWFNTNIFGGNAPTIIFSVWNIVLYEFVMDLIFLLYALFMWFIDVTKRLIEKPLDSIK